MNLLVLMHVYFSFFLFVASYASASNPFSKLASSIRRLFSPPRGKFSTEDIIQTSENVTIVEENATLIEDRVIHNVIIIGSGPAGCTAAIYAGRALLQPIVITGYQAGGQLMITSDVENFPGYKNAVSGPELMDDLIGQAKSFGAEFRFFNCDFLNVSSSPFQITLSSGEILFAHSVIIGTGADASWLNAVDENKYRGKGISACATCDGFLFQNKSVVVIGGGDSAMEEALFLTRFASEVTIIHRRDSFRASKLMLQRVLSNPKIKIMTGFKVVQWLGNNEVLTGAMLSNTVDDSTHEIHCEGAFIAIGHIPNSKFIGHEIERDVDGFIKLTHHTMTTVPGVFACGDVVDRRYRQAVTAAGSGCQAAIDAERWLEERLNQKEESHPVLTEDS